MEKLLEIDDEVASQAGSMLSAIDVFKSSLSSLHRARQDARKELWLKLQNLYEAVHYLKAGFMMSPDACLRAVPQLLEALRAIDERKGRE
jgi:hypothetical protein